MAICVLCLFLAVQLVGPWSVVVAFPGHMTFVIITMVRICTLQSYNELNSSCFNNN